MLLVFCAGVVWFAYIYFGYPALLGLLGLFRRVRPRLSEDCLPTISVLIAARNEERDIGWKIAETLAWDYPPDRLEILVGSDASEDRTDEIVRGFAGRRVSLLRMERRGGKNRILNRLAEQARGELLFFTDANSHIGPQALRRMARHFAEARVGCVTGRSRSIREQEDQGLGSGDRVYFGYEWLIKNLESNLGSVLVCDGAIFCMRRNLYCPVLPELANDLELPLRVGAAGYWVRFEPSARVTERDTDSPGEEFARRRRICGQGALALWRLRGALAGLRGWQFVSHKVMRWLTAVPLLLLLVSSGILSWHPVFALFFGLQAAFYLLALTGLALSLAGRRMGRVFAVPCYIVVTAVGALAGVIDAALGRRFDLWQSPALSRGQTAASQQEG